MTRHRLALLLILAAGVGMALVLPAHAQALPSDDNPDAVAETDATEASETDIRELDWSQLNVDASTLPPGPAAKARLPKAAGGTDMSWTAKDKSNGAAAVSVKQPLSPFWDARIGADMTVVDQPQTLTSADLLRQKISSDGQPSQSSGTAWAAITAPGVGSIWDKTAIEARVDPSQEQGKLGTSLTKSLPLGEQYSLTLQNGYNIIQQGIVPVPGIAAHPVRNYQTEQSAKLSHRRYRHQPDRRPVAVVHRGQMASQDRRRAETVRRRHHQRLDRRNRARHLEQESHRGIQAQLVRAAFRLSPPIPGKIEHCRILAAMRSKSAALMASLNFVVRGTTALGTHAKQGNNR